MFEWFRTSLIVRATFSVVTVVLLVGMLFSLTAMSYFKNREQAQAYARLDELLKTVESTASVSCFLRDAKLASEVSRGLMKSRIVKHVAIIDSGKVLAMEGSPASAIEAGAKVNQATTGRLTRVIASPFPPHLPICSIVLEPDAVVIGEQVAENTRPIFYLLIMQALGVAMTIAFVVWKWITQPIKTISDQLHLLPIEEGAQLSLPRKRAGDEIGRMVRDVNALIARLIRTLAEERELRLWREREEKRFRTIFEKAETGMFVTDHLGEITSHNPALARILGMPDGDPHTTAMLTLPQLLDIPTERISGLIDRTLSENRVVTEDFHIAARGNYTPKWISLVLSPMDEGAVQGLINDITERKQAEESANHLAHTDALTGIANRLGFEQVFAKLAEQAARTNGDQYYLMLIDLDGFKQVNDTYGHDAGDVVLQRVSARFEQVLRKTDFVGRLGGDEFVILLESGIQREGVERIAHDVISSAAMPIVISDGTEVRIGASVGIAASEPGGDKDRTFKNADTAMYCAKRAGKNTFRFH